MGWAEKLAHPTCVVRYLPAERADAGLWMGSAGGTSDVAIMTMTSRGRAGQWLKVMGRDAVTETLNADADHQVGHAFPSTEAGPETAGRSAGVDESHDGPMGELSGEGDLVSAAGVLPDLGGYHIRHSDPTPQTSDPVLQGSGPGYPDSSPTSLHHRQGACPFQTRPTPLMRLEDHVLPEPVPGRRCGEPAHPRLDQQVEPSVGVGHDHSLLYQHPVRLAI